MQVEHNVNLEVLGKILSLSFGSGVAIENHPGLVSLIELGMYNPVDYIIIEELSGLDLFFDIQHLLVSEQRMLFSVQYDAHVLPCGKCAYFEVFLQKVTVDTLAYTWRPEKHQV